MPHRVVSAALLDALPLAAYTCDPAGRITAFNRPAADLWGREPGPAERYCGSLTLSTPAGEPVPHDRCWMALALHEGKPFHGRPIRVGRPDGRTLDALAFAHPLHTPDGRLVGAVNVLLDVTTVRQAEADILRAVAALRDRDPERSTALINVLMHLERGLTGDRPPAPLLPICSFCKAIRDAAGAWQPIERVLTERTGATLTHGLCPSCAGRHYPGLLPNWPTAGGPG